ncbi:RHS repeat domain-containing protein [Chromobacterium vaccinii]|uniref:RHS repeat domain-containing protein n=1 Tax=Chromobacterium vaccinii TaxID=1108595 RepID=A0ABV0F7J4_9NEIS
MEKRVNGSLTQLEWDSHNRLSRLTTPDGQRTDYHYDPLGRRIAKISQGQATLYGWDGDVLAFETRDEEAVHYLFEPDSFVPLAQVHTDAIRGVKVPAWSQHNPYDPDKDPLRQPSPAPPQGGVLLPHRPSRHPASADRRAWFARAGNGLPGLGPSARSHRRCRLKSRDPQPLPFPGAVS